MSAARTPLEQAAVVVVRARLAYRAAKADILQLAEDRPELIDGAPMPPGTTMDDVYAFLVPAGQAFIRALNKLEAAARDAGAML